MCRKSAWTPPTLEKTREGYRGRRQNAPAQACHGIALAKPGTRDQRTYAATQNFGIPRKRQRVRPTGVLCWRKNSQETLKKNEKRLAKLTVGAILDDVLRPVTGSLRSAADAGLIKKVRKNLQKRFEKIVDDDILRTRCPSRAG